MSQDNITGMQSLASLEFYEGSLMALDTLQEMGLNLEVSLFDDPVMWADWKTFWINTNDPV